MANKDYSNFDFDEYFRKQKNQSNSGDSDADYSSGKYSNFDFDDYYKRQKLPEVAEGLNSSVNSWLESNKSFFDNYNGRIGNRDEDPLKWSYESDAGDWLNQITTQRTELDNGAEDILSILNSYGSYLNEDYVKAVTEAINGNRGQYDNIVSFATKDNEYWSSFKDEEDYKKSIEGLIENERLLSTDTKALEAEIADLEAKLNKTGNPVERFGYKAEDAVMDFANWLAGGSINPQSAGDYIGSLEAQISEKRAYLNLAQRAQTASKLESDAKVDPEFEKYAQVGADVEIPTLDEVTGVFAIATWRPFGESPKNKVTYSRDETNRAEFMKKKAEGAGSEGGAPAWVYDINELYWEMTEDEVNTYNYYLGKDIENGTNLSDEYLDSIDMRLRSRAAEKRAAPYKGKPVESVVFGLATGLEGWFTNTGNLFSNEDYIPPTVNELASGIVRENLEDTGAMLPDWLGGSSVGQTAFDLASTTGNMLPSILVSVAVELAAPTIGEGVGVFVGTQAAQTAGKIAGAAMMGMSAAGSGKAEMLRLGYSQAQANSYGLMVGAAEAGMEYALGSIPGISKGDGIFSSLGAKAASKVDNAISRVAIKLGNKGTTILRAAANGAFKIAGGMADEALEEGLQTIIEPWLKEIATNVDWDDPNLDEILYSSLLGALSSFALGGVGDVRAEINTAKAGNTIRKIDGGVAKLQSLGSTFSADTVAYKIASKVDAFTDAYTIGKLINEVGGTISEQNLTDIVNGLVAKGMRKSDATKIAKQYQAFLNNEMAMSDEQVQILESLSPLADVLRKNIIGANTTVYQRTRAYSDLMGLANDVANGKKGVSTQESSRTNISEETKAKYEKIASEVASGKMTSAAGQAVKKIADSAKSTAEAKLGVEGKYTSTNTGANRLASDKKKVNIVGVDSISKDGTMKLKLDDGSVVDAEDINFSTSDLALVYEAVAKMGVNPNTAWEILKAYDPKSGQSGTMYAMGALEAYTYGHNGVKVEGMSKDGFAALLSPVQKNTANKLGDIDAKAKVEAQQKTIDKAEKTVRDKAKSKHKAIPKRNGGVVLEGEVNRANLSDYEESQIDVLGKMAEGLGVTFHIFKSDENFKYTMPDGTVRSANGWYDPKTGEIWIDLKAGNAGQGTIIFTAAHELTHFIKQWSPAKFKVFADFLMEQYGKKGQSIDQLVQRRIEELTANGRTKGLSATEIYDLAYEEIVADSAQTFLRDSKAAEKIAALREKDRGLANKIKTFLGQMLAKLRKVLADNEILPEPHEANIVAEMTDSLEKLYNLWTDALADAGEAYSTVGGEIDLDGGSNVHKLSDRTIIEGAGLQFIPDADGTHYTVLDAYGNAVESVTPEMIAKSPLGQLVSSAKDNGFLGEGKIADSAAKKQYEFLAELVNMCINYDGLAPIWETAGTMVFSSIKSNADKQYGLTIDFSTVCKKTQAIVDAMSEAMVRLGRGLTRSEVETIYLEVGKAGESTPCPVCYVFSRWMGIGGILDQMSRFQDKYTNMSEGELQSFIADIKERISERANTPNKKGELKKDFFDKNGAIKEGQVIADLKQKANSGAGSTLNAITKNSDTQLQIQELKALMENQDAKEAKKTATKIKKLEAKLVDVSALEKQFKEYNDAVEEYEAYQWLTRTLMEEVDGNWVKNKQFKPVPKDVLFDLNKGATFAEDYPLSWAFRTGKGASAGKAITPYADARVGEAIQGIASQDVKNIKTGIDLNPFLNGDEKTRQKIIASAIEKQARQNLIGGQRYQSTSDFRYEYGSDYLITFLEMQAVGAKVQLYTKVIEAVDFLASMGADINLSVMPLSDGYVTLPDGTKKLIYSSVTGIDAEAAIKKSHEYNNVQLILVGISDEHIRLALEGDDVTFVIPFHGSGNSVHQIQALMNLLGENLDVTTAQDYTAVQSDHVSPKQTKEQKAVWDLRVKILTGKASTLSAKEIDILNKNTFLKDLYERFYVDENAEEFGIALTSDVAGQIFPYEYWDKSLTYAEADKNGERFKEYCASMGIIPRFSGMNSKGENVGFGDFTNNKGYWKLLIDRPMYDNTYDADGNWTGYGKYHEQKRINCSNFQVKHLDPEYGSATYGEVMSKANDPKKTNMIVDRAIAQFEDAKFSDRVLMGSLFSGGGTLEAGLVYQMLDKEFAVEFNKKIAATYTDNHGKEHMFVGDVRDFNSKDKQNVFYLHASPVCKNFSPASHSGGETTLDITTAQATARVLEEQMPQVFTVENVKRYIGSEAYNIIINKLNELGYTWDVDVYKASDYGNATKRERMIIRAVKDGELPAKPQKVSKFTSWGEATRDLWETDLIPSTLVRSKIEAIKNTPQLKGVKLTKLDKPLLIYDTTKSKTVSFAWADELAPTLTTKCGDARIIMPDGRAYAPTPKFMGRIQGLPDDYKYPKATTNAFKIIGNGIPTQLTKAVMGGVLDSAYEQTHDGQVLYSDRNYSEGLSEADKEVADKVVKNLKQKAMSAKYGIRTSGTYTEERMDREIAYSYAEGIPDYANSYITWVNPIDFVYATTTSAELREHLKEEAGDLNIDKLTNERQPIYLTVNFETGQITGHEGRHRMLALNKAGIDRVAVIIEARYDDIYHTKPIETMYLKGQNFGSYQSGTDFFLHDMLPLSQRYADVARQVFSFDGKNGVRFSDRSPSAVSTRSLLANALETTAQNDIERTKLEQYKSKIDLIEKEQARLTEIKAELRKLDFPTKGTKKDTARVKALRFEANQIANRINTYDRQLLNLESTTALKNVLQREKKLAYDKAKKEGKEALAKRREQEAKTIRALMDKNTESRKKAVEGRNKTEMRGKIKKVVGDLKTLLLDPTKDKHVPIGLQKPVAEALDIINMDTVGADERIAKYNDMIHKSKDPDIIAELTKSRDRIALQGANLSDKLTALKQAYAEIKNSDDSLIRDSYNEAIEDLIANTADKVGNTSLRDMSYEQLEAVYDMYKAILATVRNANKLFKANMQEIITDNSEAVKREVRAAGGHRDRVLKATKFLKKFGWNMLKPIYAMKLIGSDTLTRLYENVRKGEDTWAVDVNEAKDFFKETAKKYEYNTWDLKKQYQFTDSAGHSFSLTLEQIMSLYAYSKRSQADKHLELGGFIFDDAIEVKEKTKLGIPLTYEVNDANPYRLKKDALGKIIDLVKTDMPNVKGFVDEMQAYLSDVMGAKGNEVSLAMYDIKLYKEQNYFPLKTAKYFREFDPEKNGTPKIKNSGFSKKTVPQAGNPIILSNFMDVWANHVNDMSMYHAFVLPLEDFMRVYNYSSTAGGYDSVQQYIKNAYGSQANTYIETLMNDLNGGARTDPATDLIGKGMSLFKKAAVFASASVVIQQPSAIARTLAYIDPKYFVDKPVPSKHSETWAEVKKYAPVAIIKEMGYFDTNMGRSTVDFIKSQEYTGIKEKFKAVFTDSDYRDEALSKAPALADELAWCAIWKAVKREVADSTNLKVGSEEFLKMAGKRFTEVVTKTQVYDSVLSRSALMRSKDTGAKMVTAFMAEPTTSLNMVVDALIEGKRGNKKFAGRAIGAVAASIILNSILVSFVTAARDDDEDETYTEKYLESLTAELIDGFNPLTYIPLVKDIWSIAQGYDVERSDMSIWSDLWQSVENLFSDNKSGWEKTEGVVGAVASIFGLPLKNLMKDARAMYNLAETLLSGTPTTWAGVGDAIGGSVKDSIPLYNRIEKWVGADESKSDKLYEAIISGDQNQIDRVKAQYKDDKAIESAIRQGLRENDSRIRKAAQARYDGDIEEYKRIAKEIIAEGHFSQDTVVAAINAEINAIKKEEDDPKTEEDVEEATSIYKASDINSAFDSGDTDMALEVIEELFNTKVENYLAEARKEAEEDGKRFNERTARKEAESKANASLRASMTSYWKPLYKEAYKSGNTAEKERIERILKASGLYGNSSEVIKTVRQWRTERD